MTLLALDHVNIRTARLAEMTRFYEEVLGLPSGPRPPFAFGGSWLYCGAQAAVHLVEVGQTQKWVPGAIEHFAFRAEGLAEFLARLRARNTAYRISIVPKLDLRQINLHDPDGNHIHVDFAANEEADLSDFAG